jgi:VWFA-related protein
VAAVAQNPVESGVSIKTSVREVVVDVTVRDKHGKIVKNLKPEEISIYEDGVRQDVRSFQLVSGHEIREQDVRMAGGGSGKGKVVTKGPAPQYSPMRSLNMVCLVFQDLDPKSRKLAYQSAASFVNNELRPNTMIGIMSLDNAGIHPVYPFSNNRAELLQAIARAASGQLPSINASEQLYIAMGFTNMFEAGNPPPIPGATPTTGGNLGFMGGTILGSVGVEGMTGDAAQIAAAPLGARQGMEADRVVGVRELHSLGWLVAQMSQIPFEKTVVLFSAGINRPADQMDYWTTLIHKANAAGLTFYAFDPTGLTAPTGDIMGPETPQTNARAAAQNVASLSQAQGTPVSTLDAQMDRMQQGDFTSYAMVTANTRQSLRDLAESTGGFLVADTNNAEKQLSRIMESVDTHYELAYRPTSDNYDGHFRRIEVKLDKSDLRAEARPGYFAVPDTPDSGPLTVQDLAALRALNTVPPPHAIDYRAGALQFRSPNGGSEIAIAFDLPMANLTASPELDQKHKMHASLLALVKDEHGQVVDKFSSDDPMDIPDKDLVSSQAGRLLYNHPVDLPPGHYTVQTAVIDWQSDRASTSTVQVDSVAAKGPGLSTVVLVRSVDKVEGAMDASDPFEFSGKRVVPALFTDLPSGTQPTVFFRVYPDKSSDAKPQLRVQCLLDGQLIANQTADIPPADSPAGEPFGIGVPGKPGSYEVKIAALQGNESAEQSIRYTIAK